MVAVFDIFPHDVKFTAFPETPGELATAAAGPAKVATVSTSSKLVAALKGQDKEVVDDSHCGGRGCCDDKVASAANVGKTVNLTQLIPEIAALSFGLGMCCVWVAGRKKKPSKQQKTKETESDSD